MGDTAKILAKLGMFLGVFITVGAIGFAISLYSFMGFLEENLIYMAVYYDDVAVDLYNAGADPDAVIMASATASSFCDLYKLERRTLDATRYFKLCDAIEARSSLMFGCAQDLLGPGCSDEKLEDLDSMLEEVEDLARQVKESRPYFSYVFKTGGVHAA